MNHKKIANITRTTLCMADDICNAYGVSDFSYENNEEVLSLINRIMSLDGFTEIGNNRYKDSWVFLFDGKPIGCITHKENKMTIRAFFKTLPPTEKDTKISFHFERVEDNKLVEFLINNGMHPKFIKACGIEENGTNEKR